MSDFQVRGCCCGVPFGCGTAIVLLLGWLLWELAAPPGLVAALLSPFLSG